MAIRRQAYEWRNVCPIGNQFTIGHPVLDPNPIVPPVSLDYEVGINSQVVSPVIRGGHPTPIFTGMHGNNLNTSAHVLAIQMIIIDSLSCWPPEANVNVFVNDTYYFEAPDYSAISGLSGYTVPFPEPNYPQYFTLESFKDGIDPPIYILPGDTVVFLHFSQNVASGKRLLGKSNINTPSIAGEDINRRIDAILKRLQSKILWVIWFGKWNCIST